MNRLCLWVFAAAFASAAGCTGNSGADFFSSGLPPANGGGSPPPQSAVTFTEYSTTDTLLVGLTSASDGNIYVAATTGLDIFSPATGTIHRSLASAVRPQTWPIIPNKSSQPSGAVSSAASVVSALGSSTSSTASATRIRDSSAATTPLLATYTISSQTFSEAYGAQGDVFEDVVQSADGTPWVTANHPAVNGLVGYIFTTKAGCTPPTVADAIGSIILGVDNFIWFASDPRLNSKTPSQIFRMNPANGQIVNTYTLAANSAVAGMTGGPDGALWFTDVGLNEIGRLGTDGSVTYYAVPTANSGVFGITGGCDGALYFTEQHANQIGRITTAGVVSEYPVPTANAGLGEIVGCLGNALYFTETHAIGKLVKN